MLTHLDRLVTWTIAALAATLLVTAFGQVIARYLFAQPFTWVLELDVMLMVWLTMLSGYVGVRRNIHMAVDFVIVKWPPRWRKAVSLGGLAASAGFTAVLAWQALPVIESMEGMNFVALDLGQTWMYWSVPVGAVLMLVAFAAEALRRLASPDGR